MIDINGVMEIQSVMRYCNAYSRQVTRVYAIDTSKTLSAVIVLKYYVCNTCPNLWPFAAVLSTICANLYLCPVTLGTLVLKQLQISHCLRMTTL